MLAKLFAAVLAALLLAGSALPATQAPDNVTQPPAAAETLLLTQAEAEAIALTHAGVTAGDVTALRSHYDVDDGIPQWDVDFRVGDWEYDYSIHAETGAVLEWDKDYEPVKAVGKPVETQPAETQPAEAKPAAQITQAQAKAIALEKAGLAEDQARKLEIELDREKGILIYEVEFQSGAYEYDFDINAATGEIIRWHKEIDD